MRFRLYPTPAQELLLREQCAHARYVRNLGQEQPLMWARWKGPTPGYVDQAWRNFFAGTHHRPTWRKRGTSEGLRVVGTQALRVRHVNGRWSSVLVPKVGRVSFRRTRALVGWKSYRITRDRAGRWHLAFAVVPEPVLGPGRGEVVGVDRGVSVAVALSSGEMTSPGKLAAKEVERLLRFGGSAARLRASVGDAD